MLFGANLLSSKQKKFAMTFTDKKSKLDYLLELIKHESTGNANFLCDRLYISRRSLFRYITTLRELGYQIGYCKTRETCYFY
jgi:predicted DNA-binding transcriptional regulator YafY